MAGHLDHGLYENDPAEVTAEERLAYLVSYWALGRDPEPRDEAFLNRLADVLGDSSVPEAVGIVGDSLRKEAGP